MKGNAAALGPMAAEVGAEIPESGGSVFDAAVAAAFTQTVFDSFHCGLGVGAVPTMPAPVTWIMRGSIPRSARR